MKSFLKNLFNKSPEQIVKDKRKREIFELVRDKEKVAMSSHQFDELQREQINLTAKGAAGIATPQEQKRLKAVQASIEESSLRFDNLFDFKLALESLSATSRSFVQKTLNHENAHANKAEQLGLPHEAYTIILTNSPSFGSSKQDVTPTAMVNLAEFPEGWTSGKIKDVTIEVTFAPEQYGDKMSDADRKLYDYLQESKKTQA